ncbi:addiction module toxin, HicA family [Candidatus Woesearchaeota archaeon]|nr:addiction module toxin, HicA family [Candidatus Woesearchaeota archaeon]
MAGVVANLDVKRKNNEVRIGDLRKERAELEADVIKLEKTLHLDSADLDASKKEKEKIDSELSGIDKDFEKVRQEGSHVFFRHPDGRTTVVPNHPGEKLDRGLLNKIIKKDIGISREELMKHL